MSRKSNHETNIAIRVDAVRCACDAYTRAKGGDYYDEERTVMIDLLTDLMHMCDSLKLDFIECLKLAEIHHRAEK